MSLENVLPDSAEIDSQGRLSIGGCLAIDLAEEHGTPVYVLDEATIRNRCREFVSEFNRLYPGTQVLYASKAYINPALARIFNEEGLGLDVVSGGELAVAQAAGFRWIRCTSTGTTRLRRSWRRRWRRGSGG